MELVVMVHKLLKDQPIAVPEASVEAHEFMGWRRANKKLQAEAEQVRVDATPTPTPAQEG